MSFQALEEAFERQTLTISTLRKFQKAHLQNLCKVKCIKISHDGKKVLKEKYVQALFNAVSGYKVSDTRAKESNFRSLESLRLPVNEGLGDALLGMMEVCWLRSPQCWNWYEFPLVMQFKLNTLRQKLTRKDTEPASPEIVLDNPAMDIDQGDTNSPNPGSSELQDA